MSAADLGEPVYERLLGDGYTIRVRVLHLASGRRDVFLTEEGPRGGVRIKRSVYASTGGRAALERERRSARDAIDDLRQFIAQLDAAEAGLA